MWLLFDRQSLPPQPRPEKHTIPNRIDREKRTVEWPVEYACLGKTWITAKYPCFRMRKGPKKMNTIYEFIFSSRRRTKKMDNGQLFMFTRKKEGRPDRTPDHSISTKQKVLPVKCRKDRFFINSICLARSVCPGNTASGRATIPSRGGRSRPRSRSRRGCS